MRNSDQTWLGRVLELMVAATHSLQLPTIFLDQPDQILASHVHSFGHILIITLELLFSKLQIDEELGNGFTSAGASRKLEQNIGTST